MQMSASSAQILEYEAGNSDAEWLLPLNKKCLQCDHVQDLRMRNVDVMSTPLGEKAGKTDTK